MDVNKYRIDLLSVGADPVKYEFALDNQYFKDIDGPEIQKGNVKAIVEVSRKHSSFVLKFKFEGSIVVACDRCLDDMDLPVYVESELKVRFGDEFRDDDEWVIVPEEEGYIDTAWFMYEFIALSIPIQHVHEEGQCNKEMMEKLNEHRSSFTDDDFAEDEVDEPTGEATDPRWNELKKILNK